MRNHARAIGEIDTRVQRRFAAVVVNELFLTTGLAIDGPPILVKGGTAMDLRRGIAPARLSRDWDAVVRADLDAFLAAARPALEAGWSGFTAYLAREEVIHVPGLAVSPRRFQVKLSYRGKPFATVPVEISEPEGDSALEYDTIDVREYRGIGIEPEHPVYCLSVRYQIAQKIHACTDPLDPNTPNTRARDLVDLQLLAPLVDAADFADVRRACLEVFEGRGRHPWPPTVRTWPDWAVLYRAATETLGPDVATDVNAAAEWLSTFVGAINAATSDP